MDQSIASLEPDIICKDTRIKSAVMIGATQGLGVDDIVVGIRRTYKIRVDRKVVKALLWSEFGL